MGTYGSYTGGVRIPDDRKEDYIADFLKLLDYGGILQFDQVSLFGKTIYLAHPVELDREGKAHFHYSYFEDDPWESAGFDSRSLHFYTNKIGGYEFSYVMTALRVLTEMYDEDPGYAEVNGDVIGAEDYIGWINHLCGREFSAAHRFRLWNFLEKFGALCLLDEYKSRDVLEQMTRYIPRRLRRAMGGTELADILFILGDSETISEEAVPWDYGFYLRILRDLVREYLDKDPEEGEKAILSLVKEPADERGKHTGEGIADIAIYSECLPARVLLFCLTEYKGIPFWAEWKKIKDDVYRDEKEPCLRQPEKLLEFRKRLREEPIPPVTTSSFLRRPKPWLRRNELPEELQDKPDYYISDDDRAYWWDGSDEVVLSESMTKWLEGLAKRHKALQKDREDGRQDPTHMLRRFICLLADIEQYYKRVYCFQSMFYEFLQSGWTKPYLAAIDLLEQLYEENKEAGKVIELARSGWELTHVNITFNEGRLNLKRYLSVLANVALRKQYFGF